jgi:hypothetical protein
MLFITFSGCLSFSQWDPKSPPVPWLDNLWIGRLIFFLYLAIPVGTGTFLMIVMWERYRPLPLIKRFYCHWWGWCPDKVKAFEEWVEKECEQQKS